ncbi:MAG: hypothetical protein ACLQVG_07865 [Terriglobia bacterium]
MKRRSILIVAGLLLLAFGLGIGVGSRFVQRSHIDPVTVVSQPPASAPETPAEGSPPACVDIRNAGPLVGKNGCVTGLVLRAYTARTGNTFLDFCQDYRTCPFTSVIFSADKGKFGNLESLQGKRVEIRGNVVTYQGHAEIIIHDPHQVRGGE